MPQKCVKRLFAAGIGQICVTQVAVFDTLALEKSVGRTIVMRLGVILSHKLAVDRVGFEARLPVLIAGGQQVVALLVKALEDEQHQNRDEDVRVAVLDLLIGELTPSFLVILDLTYIDVVESFFLILRRYNLAMFYFKSDRDTWLQSDRMRQEGDSEFLEAVVQMKYTALGTLGPNEDGLDSVIWLCMTEPAVAGAKVVTVSLHDSW